jgi:Rod binding domain-containing protein
MPSDMDSSSLIGMGKIALQAAQVPPRLGRADTAAKAEKVAQDFEAFFLAQVLQPMFASIDVEPPFGGGSAEEVWRSMMVDEMGRAMAKAGGIGLAAQVKREMLRMQEMQP